MGLSKLDVWNWMIFMTEPAPLRSKSEKIYQLNYRDRLIVRDNRILFTVK